MTPPTVITATLTPHGAVTLTITAQTPAANRPPGTAPPPPGHPADDNPAIILAGQ